MAVGEGLDCVLDGVDEAVGEAVAEAASIVVLDGLALGIDTTKDIVDLAEVLLSGLPPPCRFSKAYRCMIIPSKRMNVPVPMAIIIRVIGSRTLL